MTYRPRRTRGVMFFMKSNSCAKVVDTLYGFPNPTWSSPYPIVPRVYVWAMLESSQRSEDSTFSSTFAFLRMTQSTRTSSPKDSYRYHHHCTGQMFANFESSLQGAILRVPQFPNQPVTFRTCLLWLSAYISTCLQIQQRVNIRIQC